jgi:DNA-binding transcriptional LysR family regulator
MKKSGKLLKGSEINWNQVFYFSEIAAYGSIKEAAEKLKLTPPTLSEHLAQLERDLDVQLFIRRHRRLELTPQGQRLFLHAKQMFEAGQRLIDVVSPIPLGSYPISIGLVPSPSAQLATNVIASYLEKFGPVGIKIHRTKYQELEKNLVQSQFDFAFSDRLPERKDILSFQICSSVIRFYVSSRWSESKFSELIKKLPLLVCNAEPEARSHAELALLESDISAPSVITSDYPSVLIDLCDRGLGIGVFSEEPIKKMNMQSLKSLRAPTDAPQIKDTLYALWSQDAENSEAVQRLIEVLKIAPVRPGISRRSEITK